MKKNKKYPKRYQGWEFYQSWKENARDSSFFTNQIKKRKLVGDQLDQASDSFLTLFETQLEKNFLSPNRKSSLSLFQSSYFSKQGKLWKRQKIFGRSQEDWKNSPRRIPQTGKI